MFRVAWLQAALDDLAEVWMQADSTSRQAITDAVREIDRDLQSDPDGTGESRGDGKRILFHPPLGVMFEVHSPHRLVRVLHVWCFRRREGA